MINDPLKSVKVLQRLKLTTISKFGLLFRSVIYKVKLLIWKAQGVPQ